MAERPRTARTFVRFDLRRWRDVVRIVVQIHVASQQLLLAERLLAHVALERLLVGVNEQVGFEVTCRNGRVRAEVALVALFSFVRFGVHLVRVPVVVQLAAAPTLERFVQRSMQLLDVDAQVRLAAARRGAELAVEHRLVAD